MKEELEKRIEELKSEKRAWLIDEERIKRLEQLYDDLYGI